VLVVEREEEAGGVPRHCAHTGFGVRDLRRVLSGPRYARRIVDLTERAGVEVSTRTMVTGWASPRVAEITGPAGVERVGATAVVLATGARERPRAARLVPGDRPAGVLTTGELQQLVHVRRGAAEAIGRRAVVVGAEHVSYSALLTLRRAGVRPIGMITSLERHQTVGLFALAAATALRVPLWTGTSLSAIRGRGRVSQVELAEVSSGRTRTIDADTVVFSGDWIPDHELARAGGLKIDPGTRGPAADLLGRTSGAGIFAAGNLVHPVEPADVVACRAARVGLAVADWLRAGTDPVPARLRVVATDGLLWVFPNLVAPGAADHGPFAIRSREHRHGATVVVEQGGQVVARHRLRRAVPNRTQEIPGTWVGALDPQAGAVLLRIEG